MSRNQALLVFGIAVLIVAGLVFFVKNTGQNTLSENTTVPSSQEVVTFVPAEETLNGCVRTFDEAELTAPGADFANTQVVMKVKGFGDMTIELYDKDAPKTVENFVRLASSGFYDCLTFHRIAKGFVIQGGDPTGTGTGGRTASGNPLPDELNPQTESYKQGYVKGVLAMANKLAPNSGTSQFFIMLGDVDLDHKYTIFGKVIAGLDVVDRIGAVEITPQMGSTDGMPTEPVVIEKLTIKDK